MFLYLWRGSKYEMTLLCHFQTSTPQYIYTTTTIQRVLCMYTLQVTNLVYISLDAHVYIYMYTLPLMTYVVARTSTKCVCSNHH